LILIHALKLFPVSIQQSLNQFQSVGLLPPAGYEKVYHLFPSLVFYLNLHQEQAPGAYTLLSAESFDTKFHSLPYFSLVLSLCIYFNKSPLPLLNSIIQTSIPRLHHQDSNMKSFAIATLVTRKSILYSVQMTPS
jgi:hypothetical protein